MWDTSHPVGEAPSDKVTFVVLPKVGRSRTYEAEKWKLASVSQVFSVLFQQLPPDETNHVITITDFSPKAFKVMLRHVFEKLYVLDDWELSIEVYCVAEKYGIHSLQRTCEEFFTRTPITSSNALEVFKLASNYGVQVVLSLCDEVFEKDLGDVLLKPNFLSTEKDIVKKIVRHKVLLQPVHLLALINWAMHECSRRGVICTASNVEKCVISVCSTSLAICISKVITKIEKLRNAKSTGNMKSRYESTELSPPQRSRAVSVLLCDSTDGTIMSSFSRDIICELKISVYRGVLEFTGIELRLKSRSFSSEEGPLEIYYSTENQFEDIIGSDTKIDGTFDERMEIAFLQKLIVKPEQCASVIVRIEDLQMSRCLKNSEQQQPFIDEMKGIHFLLNFSSNQSTSSSNNGPFFIEKLFYKSLQ